MANTAGVSNALKNAALGAVVNSATVKCALYLTGASVNNTTALYTDGTTPANQVSGAGYSPGGVSVTNGVTAALDGNTSHWTPGANISFGTVTLASQFDCAFLYDTAQSNRAMVVITFDAQTVNNAPFSLTIPTNNGTTGLIRLG